MASVTPICRHEMFSLLTPLVPKHDSPSSRSANSLALKVVLKSPQVRLKLAQTLMDGRIEPAALRRFPRGEPVQVGDNQHYTDRPQEVHNLCQRSEVVLLLAHKM